MITTHSTSNYRNDLYTFLSSSTIEGYRQDPYFDSVGQATIGVGFNIEGDSNVQRYVLNQLGVFAGRTDQEIETIRKDFEATIINVPNGDEIQLVTVLNAKLRQYLGAQTTTLFTMNTTQSRSVFEQILGDSITGQTTIGQSITKDGKQKELDSKLQIVGVASIEHDTKEYVALMAMFYNQKATNPLIGEKLLSALRDGSRAEAWFEIRYNSNGGASSGRGIANRRYAESNTFGLYENTTLNDAEAKSIFQMYTEHRETIYTYEGNTRTSPATGESFASRASDARTTLLSRYSQKTEPFGPDTVSLPSIDGEVLVGNDDLRGDLFDVRQISIPGVPAYIFDLSKNDLMFGEGGRDTLHGHGGSDVLYGGAAGDELHGEEGEDYLFGGTEKIRFREGTTTTRCSAAPAMTS